MHAPERQPSPRPPHRQEKADMSDKDFYRADEEYSLHPEGNGDLSSTITLPRNRLSTALIIGAVAGIVTALIYFLIPFLNAQAFQRAATLGVKMSYQTAVTVTELRCISVFVAIVVCAFVGYFVGKYAVQRRLGFFAGLIAGVIFSFGQTISGYIPNYPGSSATPPFSPAYILPFLIITLILGCLAGLISLLVTWMTTRKHPYYRGI